MMDKFADNTFFRGLLSKIHFSKRLPSEFERRPIVVTPDARLKFLYPGSAIFESEYGDLLEVAQNYIDSDDVVWDVGSNVGVFTFAAGSQAGGGGKVLSIEPDIELVRLLRKSSRRRKNADLNIDILSSAVAEKSGISVFYIAKRGRTTNTLADTVRSTRGKQERKRQLVPTVTLDQLLDVSQPPDFLKIDVEGAEDLVLEGGAKVLNEVRPTIYCEVGKEKQEAVTNLFKKVNYLLFDPSTSLKPREALSTCVFNTLALPEETIG